MSIRGISGRVTTKIRLSPANRGELRHLVPQHQKAEFLNQRNLASSAFYLTKNPGNNRPRNPPSASVTMAATYSHVAETWDQRPPYARVNESEPFEKKYEGKCQCGRVKYWLKREAPLSAKYCHCRGCQLLHGECFQDTVNERIDH